MSGILCSMVGASFVTAVAEVIRFKKGITAVGNAQVDTAQYKFGGASLLLDGTNDRLEIYPTTTYTDFTVECWIRLANNSGTKNILSFGNESSGRVFFAVDNDRIYWDEYGSQSRYGNTSMSANTWYHLAWSRTGSTIKLFVDGVEQTMTTVYGSGTFPSGSVGNTNGIFVGTLSDGAIDFNGHIDEIRVSNNVRYSTGFTPSTSAFVNDANTVLLIHANGTDASTFFEDDNGTGRSAKGITAIGSAQVDTAQSKFGGASLLMDGSGDRLNVTGEVLPAQYTVEYWFRLASFTSAPTFVDFRGGGADNYSDFITTGGVFTVYINSNSIVTSALSTNTWYHIAVVRDSSSDIKLYLNGTKTGVTLNDANYSSNTSWYIGDNYLFVSSADGHMDEIRVSNTARYTANFAVATTPFVNDANTVLLLHCDGTDGSTVFRDDNGTGRSAKGISANGNAQVDTAQYKFGGASAQFDGTGDYLQLDAYTDLNFGTNNFTVEFWINFTNKNNAGMFSSGTATYTTDSNVFGNDGGTSSFGFFNNPGGRLCHIAQSDFSTATWYHIAVVRSGNTFTMYLDGVAKGSSTYAGSINFNANNATRIGMATWESPTGFTGYIDEFRISNSARYTAGFTPSTTPFQSDANTLLLLHMDGTDASTVFTDDNGVTPTHSYT